MASTVELIDSLDSDVDELESALQLLAGQNQPEAGGSDLEFVIMDHDDSTRPILERLRQTAKQLRGKIRGPKQ